MTGKRQVQGPDPRRVRLGKRLRDLRDRAGLTQTELALAQSPTWTQPKVSQMENGRQLPGGDTELQQWVQSTGSSPDELTELRGLLTLARMDFAATSDLLRDGTLAERQAIIAAMEAAATRIGEYQPAMIPGLLQTGDYARAMVHLNGGAYSRGATEDELEEIVAGRIRRQNVLYDQAKHMQFVIGEAALLTPPGSAGVQVGQMDRLLTLASLATVELGVLPLRSRLVVMPLSGFRVLDEEFVFVESIVGEQRFLTAEQVTPIVKAFDALRSASVTGRAAVELIRRAAAEV